MRLLAVILTFMAFASCSTLSPEVPKYVEIDTSILQLGSCQSGDRLTTATITRVGEAYVTAKHFAADASCVAGGLPVDLHDPVDDISVIQAGDPGTCIDAVEGESIVYLGYPGTLRDGTPLTASTLALEYDVGLVESLGVTVPMPGVTLREVTVGKSRWVRPGYSGGPVVSARDGRIVGIINGIDATGYTFFTPISRVCRLIEEARHV